MSGIPTPRSGIARPSKLAAPGTMQPTKRARAEAEETQPSKKAKPSMPPPKVAPVKKPTVSSLTQRKPLSTRNTLASRTNPSLNRTANLNKTVASAQPTQEKPKGWFHCDKKEHFLTLSNLYFSKKQENQRERHGISKAS